MKFNGPPPQPVVLKLLRGNPGKRRLPRQDVEPTSGADCPADLSREAAKEWARLLPEVNRLGLLTWLDRAALAAYCEAWSDFIWAVRRIRRDGRLITAGNGTKIPHPAVQIKRQSMQKIREFSAEFGFSPAARARLEFIGKEEDGDEDERFFGKAQAGRAKKKKR